MDDIVCESGESFERFRPVKIGDNRNCAKRARGFLVLLRSGQSIDAPTAAHDLRQSQADVAASDN